MSNTFGTLFRLTSFGESHGKAVGGVIDGCPAGLPLREEDIQRELDLRRPGQSDTASARREQDRVQLLSGVFEGFSTGAPIGFIVANTEQRPQDYEKLREVYRPGHADYTVEAKYGLRDHRGGGRSSGRETVSRVVGGAVAQALLRSKGITLCAYTLAIGGVQADPAGKHEAEQRPFFSPDPIIVPQWENALRTVRAEGDSLGGLVRLEAYGLPAGLGEPVFDKLDARLGAAMFSVGAVKGMEIGSGFAAAGKRGSENNDQLLPAEAERQQMVPNGNTPQTGFASNNAGGVLGGISSGQSLLLTVAIKPIPSITKEQQSINRAGQATLLQVGGRHDACAIPRVVPVLKAMLALTLADFLLLQRSARI